MSFFSLIWRNVKVASPPTPPKVEGALRCGILGAANIAPNAIIGPARSHPEFIITAVAARDKTKAEIFAKKHGIPKTFSGKNGYQDLLDDPEIDVVYNPLPNGLHYEWTMKALSAGKHVLLEKPSADTAEETRIMFDYAQKKGLVLLEAWHSRFHPALNRVKEIIQSGELGKLKSITADLSVPKFALPLSNDDIRFNYSLGGGIMMDMGGYPLMASRYITDANPTEVISATSTPFPGTDEQKAKIDVAMTATLAFPDDVIATINCSARLEGWGPGGIIPRFPRLGLVAKCEGGDIELNNFVFPVWYHYISVNPKTGKKRTEKAYTFASGKGEDWWTTYRYQLENFVDKVKGREPRHWMTGEDSVDNMKWVEKVYEKSGLGVRPASTFVLNSEATGLVAN